MKIISKRSLLTVLLVLCCAEVFSQGGPPCPDCPPPPPGLPIDENIFILLSIAILFGVYIIFRNNLKAKSPI